MKPKDGSMRFSQANKKGILVTPLLLLSSQKRTITIQTLMSKGTAETVTSL